MKFPLFPFLLSANALPSSTATTSSIVRITKQKFGKKQNSNGQTNQLKLPTVSPSKRVPGGEQSGATAADTVANIEGVYVYTNKCSMVYQAVIGCGLLQDEDFCLYTEFKLGVLVNEDYPGSIPVPGNKDQFFLPNSELPPASDPGSVDPEKVCVFSGTFSKSARMEGNTLKPVPLVSSRGCGTGFTQYQLVMRARITNSDGDLDFGFSSDYGETYYMDEKDCPVSYIGNKQSFQDSAFPDGPLRHRALWGVSDFFTAASTVYVMVKQVVDIYVAVVHCSGNSECAGSLSTPPSSPPTPQSCWSAAYEVKYLTGFGDACGDKTIYDNRDAAENACIECDSSCNGITTDGKGGWTIRKGSVRNSPNPLETSYLRVSCSLATPVCWSAVYEGKYLSGWGDACDDVSNYDNRAAAERACIDCGSSCNGITTNDYDYTEGKYTWMIRAGSLPFKSPSPLRDASYLRVPCLSAITVPSGCQAKKNNGVGVTDSACAACKNGRTWWPCDMNPPMCEGTGCCESKNFKGPCLPVGNWGDH